MDTNILTSKVFWYTNRKAQNGIKNWCFRTMDMFNDMGVQDFKYKINCIQKTLVLDKINDLLSEKDKQRWLVNLYRQKQVGSNKLRTYRLFKKISYH